MHSAHQVDTAGAHPHQFLLQFAAEWGLPAALLLTVLLLGAAVVFTRRVRDSALWDAHGWVRVALLAAMLAATAQGMVDGLAVIPYTQVWYALVMGALWGLCARPDPPDGPVAVNRASQLIAGGGLASALYLAVFAAQTFPCVAPSSTVYLTQFGEVLRPRFWSQGFIGQDFFPADGTCPSVKP